MCTHAKKGRQQQQLQSWANGVPVALKGEYDMHVNGSSFILIHCLVLHILMCHAYAYANANICMWWNIYCGSAYIWRWQPTHTFYIMHTVIYMHLHHSAWSHVYLVNHAAAYAPLLCIYADWDMHCMHVREFTPQFSNIIIMFSHKCIQIFLFCQHSLYLESFTTQCYSITFL